MTSSKFRLSKSCVEVMTTTKIEDKFLLRTKQLVQMMAAQPKNPFVSSVADVIEELVGESHFTVAFLEDATYYLGILSIN